MTSQAFSSSSAPHDAQLGSRSIPSTGARDETLAFAREGYRFIADRCERFGSDIFQTRLMLRRTLCLRGAEAARLFYDPDKFVRKGAAPQRLQATLFGRGGVQGLDGAAHARRKQLFMSIVNEPSVAELVAISLDCWREARTSWAESESIVLFDAAQEVLMRAVCRWAGVPLSEAEVAPRTRQVAALIESPAKLGPAHWRGRIERARAEKWCRDLIVRVRKAELAAPAASALAAIAAHRDLDSELLSERVAAVELLNVLRPTVAVARYVTFAALALHEYPHCREALASDSEYAEWFVQEVRRFYPFFPATVAVVRDTFTWSGYTFPRGTRVLLDLYGTNHDRRVWQDPDQFRPERFRDWDRSPFNFIPQGGGAYHSGHRCPGERITIELTKAATGFLVRELRYEVPAQDRTIRMARMPALPESGFVIRVPRAAA